MFQIVTKIFHLHIVLNKLAGFCLSIIEPKQTFNLIFANDRIIFGIVSDYIYNHM
jgi:hypothetical protein